MFNFNDIALLEEHNKLCTPSYIARLMLYDYLVSSPSARADLAFGWSPVLNPYLDLLVSMIGLDTGEEQI